MKFPTLLTLLFFIPSIALAQSGGGFVSNQILTASELNSALSAKVDYTSPLGTFAFQNYATPPAIGGTTPNTGKFSSLTLSTPLAVPQGGTGATSFTSSAPIIGSGSSALSVGSRSGSTTVFGTTAGSLTSGDCAQFDASGNIVDSGGSCGSGGGAGRLVKLGTLSANLNTTSDQAITLTCPTSMCVVTEFIFYNCSTSGTAAGAFYTASLKGGNTFFNGTTTTAFVSAGGSPFATMAAGSGSLGQGNGRTITVASGSPATIYLSLTTTNGSALTCSMVAMGDDIS